jgi:type VI secretion system protein ImpL
MADSLRREYFAGVSNVMLLPVKENIEAFLNEINLHGDKLKPQALRLPGPAAMRSTRMLRRSMSRMAITP